MIPKDFTRRNFLGTASLIGAAALGLETASAAADAPKPASFSVDFTQPGKLLRPLNGTNFWAKLNGNRIFDAHDLIADLNFSTVRLHDIPLQNAGMRLVDTHMIFGNFSADASDPKNYYFAATDDYIKRILDGGSKVIYRLGASIEHTQPNRYFAKEPTDHDQFTAICEGIIRHFNEGWVDGFKYDIQYWEVWNEPNLNPQMWDHDFAAYCKFYVHVTKRLKAAFPHLKIGGPALTHAGEPLIRQFLQACRDAQAPVDFFSWHCYARTPEDVLHSPAMVQQLLAEYGYPNAELHLNEWHYFPCDWSEIHGTVGGAARKIYWRNCPEGMNGIDSAAFCAHVLTRWQDTPLTMSNYYATTSRNWGLLSDDMEIRKPYYAFLAFGKIMKEKPVCVATTDQKYVSLLGAASESGKKALLISNWKQNVESLEVRLSGVPASGEVTLWRLDGENDLTETRLSYTDSLLKIANRPGSWVLAIQF